MLTAVYFSSLQHKMVFLVPHGNFRDWFSVRVIRDIVKCLLTDLTGCAVGQQNLLLSAKKNCNLIHHHSLIPVTEVNDLLGCALNKENVTCRHPYKLKACARSCTFLRNKLNYFVK